MTALEWQLYESLREMTRLFLETWPDEDDASIPDWFIAKSRKVCEQAREAMAKAREGVQG